jgi:hypothetical protein
MYKKGNYVSTEFSPKILGLFWGFSAGIRGIFGVELRGGVFNDLPRSGRRFGGSPGHIGSFRLVFLIFATIGRRPRGSRGPIKVIITKKCMNNFRFFEIDDLESNPFLSVFTDSVKETSSDDTFKQSVSPLFLPISISPNAQVFFCSPAIFPVLKRWLLYIY